MERCDIAIIGSGFGAAVIAARLAAHLQEATDGAYRIVLLEKGPDGTGTFDPDGDVQDMNPQGNRYRHSLSPDYLAEVADLYTDPVGRYRPGSPSMSVIAGKGLGGGSNVYCGVSLRNPTESFERLDGDRRYWPAMYSRAGLDGHYATAEQQLHVRQMRWTDDNAPHWQLCTKRDLVFAEGANRIGATAVPLKLSNLDDPNEGWWTQGRRFQGKQHLTGNYLADAKEAGVEFWTGCTVNDMAPDGARYMLSVTDRRRGQNKSIDLEARLVFVGAGAVGSTGILLRSEENFLGARALDQRAHQTGTPLLGRHVSGNGDYGVTGFVGPQYERLVEGHKGKPMSSFSPSFWPDHRFIIIPFHTPPLYLAQEQVSSLRPAEHPDAVGRGSTGPARRPDGREVPHWGPGYKDRLKFFSDRVLTMGVLCWDEGEGKIELGPDEETVQVSWAETHPETEARWSVAAEKMRAIYRALDGDMMLDNYRHRGTVNTAHPLGGCRMADYGEPTEGIVNPDGELFTNPNLFVVDGAIIPCALGVNPSLTIAAVAESIAARLIAGDGTTSLLERLSGS